MTCDHKFIDSNHCLKCGWEAPPRPKLGGFCGQRKFSHAGCCDPEQAQASEIADRCHDCDRPYAQTAHQQARPEWCPGENSAGCMHRTIARLRAELSATREDRDNYAHRLQLEQHWHEETKGYRQHAEQQLADAKALNEAERLVVDEAKMLVDVWDAWSSRIDVPGPRLQVAVRALRAKGPR